MPGPPAVILREGGLAREDITPIIGPLRADLTPAQIRAPGQMARHYAPDVPVILGDMAVPQGALHVGFGPSDAALNLSPSADLTEAAANLFKTLHQAETMAKTTNAPAIHIATIPETGLGRAINDRLRRAAIKG
jgi:L-threonylcarbamoyladenylate synthase